MNGTRECFFLRISRTNRVGKINAPRGGVFSIALGIKMVGYTLVN